MFETNTTTTTTSAPQKHLFAYLDGRKLTVRRNYRPTMRNKGRRYDLNHISEANQQRLARVLAAFDTSVELDDDLTPIVYFFSKAVR